MKTLLLTTVSVIALIVNPFFACERDDSHDSFHYTAAEMRAAVEGTWRLRLPADHATPVRELRFSITQGDGPLQEARRGGFVREASACESRSFVRSAGACVDMSYMPLGVKLLTGTTPTQDASGKLIVLGTVFSDAELHLDVGGVDLFAAITPTGVVTYLSTHNGDLPTIALLRVSR